MNESRYNFDLVSENNTLFAAGGQDGRTYEPVYRKSMEYYQPPENNHWGNVSKTLLVSQGGRLAAAQGIVYFVGWDRNTTIAEFHTLSHYWCSADRRTMRTPRKNFAAVATDGIIYVVGGSMEVEVDGVHHETKSLQSFDPVSGETTDLADTLKSLGANVRAVVIERALLPDLEPGAKS